MKRRQLAMETLGSRDLLTSLAFDLGGDDLPDLAHGRILVSDLGYFVQTDVENAIDDQTVVPSMDIEADLNAGSISRSLLELAATEAEATDAALEEVYDSSFVDTATGTAADDLVGAILDDEYEFRTGKFAQSDYNFEMPKVNLGGDGAKDESLGKYETYDYPGLYDATKPTNPSIDSEPAPADSTKDTSG